MSGRSEARRSRHRRSARARTVGGFFFRRVNPSSRPPTLSHTPGHAGAAPPASGCRDRGRKRAAAGGETALRNVGMRVRVRIFGASIERVTRSARFLLCCAPSSLAYTRLLCQQSALALGYTLFQTAPTAMADAPAAPPADAPPAPAGDAPVDPAKKAKAVS